MGRYFRRGTTKIYFLPSVAAKESPTTGEIAAGTDLTNSVAEVAGFTFSNSPIPVPDMGSVYTKTIPGEDTSDDSSLTFYEDDVSNPIRTTLAKGTSGYILLFPAGGIIATSNVEVWPVKTTSVAREWSAGNDPARFVIQFTIPDTPATDATVAAGV